MYERNYQKRVLKDSDDEAPRPRGKRLRNILVLAGLLAILFGVVTLIRLPKLQIRTVAVEGTNVADPVEVSQYVLDRLGGYKLWVLPKTSVFLVNPHALEAGVRAAFPRFSSVTVVRDGVSKLSVSVTEYEGVYLWCEAGQTASEPCRFMDKTGVVFARAPYFSGDAYARLYGGEAGAMPFTPISEAHRALVPLIGSRLSALSIKPLEYHFVNDHELDVVFSHAGTPATIMFDPTQPLDDAFVALFTGLRTDPLAALYRNQAKVLRYIDLRFDNKIVYRFE